MLKGRFLASFTRIISGIITRAIGSVITSLTTGTTVKSKNDIIRLLENSDSKREFIEAINDLEFEFINKLKVLLSDDQIKSTAILNKNLDEILGAEKGKRTQQSLYALWHFLVDIPNSVVSKYPIEIRNDLKLLFQEVADSEDWPIMLTEFKTKYAKQTGLEEKRMFTDLGTIMDISVGIHADSVPRESIFVNYPYLSKVADFKCFNYLKQDIGFIEEEVMLPGQRHLFDAKSKILIKKNLVPGGRLQIAIVDESIAFSNDIIGLVPNRAGFLPKYVAAILYSTYTIRKVVETSNAKDDLKLITSNDIRTVRIPVIPIIEQRSLELIIDYLIHLKDSRNAVLFFERLLDALVLEFFLKDLFESAGVIIRQYVQDNLPNSTEVTTVEEAEFAYQTLSAPDHPIAGNLAKLLTISEMQNYDPWIL